MNGLTNLEELLTQMAPELGDEEYVFVTFKGAVYGDLTSLKPIAFVQEKEGLTLVVELSKAKNAGIVFDVILRRISLNVHSSLEAVGLTAAISKALAEQGISANIVAGFYHDHIFVPTGQSETALQILMNPE